MTIVALRQGRSRPVLVKAPGREPDVRVAVIDTGTNSTRLLVADVEDGRVDEIERHTMVTRLGEGVDVSGRLASAAMERVRDAVERYAHILEERQTGHTVILATSSVRDASNGGEFIAGLADRHGFSHRVLTGDEEAALSFAGTTLGMAGDLRVLLFDIGGGSTELATGSGGRPECAISLRLGCVRITEQFLGSDPPAPSELEAATAQIDSMLGEGLRRVDPAGTDLAAGVAGTVTALAAIDLGLARYDPSRVHGHILTRWRLDGMLHDLAGMTVRQRLERIPTMEPGRADVIVGGALIASRLLELAGIGEFMVSERDILDGAALELASMG